MTATEDPALGLLPLLSTMSVEILIRLLPTPTGVTCRLSLFARNSAEEGGDALNASPEEGAGPTPEPAQPGAPVAVLPLFGPLPVPLPVTELPLILASAEIVACANRGLPFRRHSAHRLHRNSVPKLTPKVTLSTCALKLTM